MDVSGYVWLLTVIGIVAMLVFDFVFHVRKAHTPTLKEAAVWSSVYVGIAILFGVGVLILGGQTMGAEYFAGYVTEKALSVDNLFVFLIIMTSFAVPRADQQKVLLFGIVFSLIARTGFIFIGAALINQFAWVFYLFGLVLLLTAGNMLKPEGEDSHTGDNIMVRIAQKLFRTTDHFDGDKLLAIENGRRVLTPMGLVMAAIGGTDILFALDSIPAIYGLTENVYIVFTATGLSLTVIIGVLLITVVASLISAKGRAQNAVTNARRHALQYLDLSYEADQQLREKDVRGPVAGGADHPWPAREV